MKTKSFLTFLLAGILTTGLTACGGNKTSSSVAGTSNPPASTQTSESSKTSETTSSSSTVITSTSTAPKSVIKELSAVQENAEIKIGEQATTASFYKLVGYKSLTAKQKRVTITSSNEEVVKIASTYKTLTAVSLGTAEITVTSDADETKSCKFTITVSDCFFDRTITSISSTWDVTNEMAEENPSIKVDSNLPDGIYARNSDGLKWFIETEITIHSVDATEMWPKFGVVANTTGNTIDTNNNKVYFFLDAAMNIEDNWTNFGVCEVSNGSNWAWNPGIGNNEARHNDAIYVHDSVIAKGTTFKVGMLRDSFNFHFYVNGNYVKSAEALHTLVGNFDDATGEYSTPANCMAGFFAFNSTVTFSNYKFVNDAATVDGMLTAITPSYCDWAED